MKLLHGSRNITAKQEKNWKYFVWKIRFFFIQVGISYGPTNLLLTNFVDLEKNLWT